MLTTATRVGFARHYDLTERVLPAEVLAREVDDERRGARTGAARGDRAWRGHRGRYPRLLPAGGADQVKPAIDDLVAAGELEPVEVDGWSAPAYLRAGQTVPRRDRGTALLCPFDPLIFFRPRVERLFDFHYRIEIYTPQPKRQFGYYVWPFLLDGELVGRVDIKADRARDALQVVGAFTEGRTSRGWRRRWQASCGRWRPGSGWPTSRWASGGIWRGRCARRWVGLGVGAGIVRGIPR